MLWFDEFVLRVHFILQKMFMFEVYLPLSCYNIAAVVIIVILIVTFCFYRLKRIFFPSFKCDRLELKQNYHEMLQNLQIVYGKKASYFIVRQTVTLHFATLPANFGNLVTLRV